MITTANYLLIAYVGGERYYFEYEDCGDMWEALEEFWHEDYNEVFDGNPDASRFAIDIHAVEEGRAIRCYETAFDCSLYRTFFDKGHTISESYTLNDFNSDLNNVRKEINNTRPH